MDTLVTQTGSMTAAIEGGFANPVFDAQLVFNRIMNAMARPGTITEIEEKASAPSPLYPSTAALIATLCDGDTPVWTDLVGDDLKAFAGWLSFQTGAPLSEHFETAKFDVISNALDMPPLASFPQGIQEYPDRSATLIIQVGSIRNEIGFILEGPGIKTTCELQVQGLSHDFAEQWQSNRNIFPLGIDVILASPIAITCLPRTVNLTVNSESGGR